MLAKRHAWWTVNTEFHPIETLTIGDIISEISDALCEMSEDDELYAAKAIQNQQYARLGNLLAECFMRQQQRNKK